MLHHGFKLGACAILLSLSVSAHAQGIVNGAGEGAKQGSEEAGPVGGVVGGVTGSINGVLGIEQRRHFREYVVREHVPSYHYEGDVGVGVVLPPEGVQYYGVPAEYHARSGYRYTVVNDEPVLVDPATRQVVQVIAADEAAAAPAQSVEGVVISHQKVPRFRAYVQKENRPSYHYDREVRAEVILPEEGMTYYEVPTEYGVNRKYGYVIINDEPVIVDSATHKVIEVIE